MVQENIWFTVWFWFTKFFTRPFTRFFTRTKSFLSKEKTETDGNGTEIENLTISETQECDETTQSTQDSCYSWSGVSQEIDIKGEKRELSDDEEGPWWKSFKSQSTRKSTQEAKLQKFKSSQPKAEASSSQDDNKSDDENEKREDEKISFYLKLGKFKKFKYI